MKNKKYESLRGVKNFKKLQQSKKLFSTNIVNLKYIKNDLGKFRVAISISKKNFKRAVIRNKIRRQIKAIIYKLNKIPESIDLLIYVKQSYKTDQFEKNEKEILKMLKLLYVK